LVVIQSRSLRWRAGSVVTGRRSCWRPAGLESAVDPELKEVAAADEGEVVQLPSFCTVRARRRALLNVVIEIIADDDNESVVAKPSIVDLLRPLAEVSEGSRSDGSGVLHQPAKVNGASAAEMKSLTREFHNTEGRRRLSSHSAPAAHP